VLEDFGPVILHVFTPDAREFYNLEKLYQETTEKDISSLISED
jgi:ribosome-associated protein